MFSSIRGSKSMTNDEELMGKEYDCSKSMGDKTSPPRICTNTAQIKNDSSSTLIEANIFFYTGQRISFNFRRVTGD